MKIIIPPTLFRIFSITPYLIILLIILGVSFIFGGNNTSKWNYTAGEIVTGSADDSVKENAEKYKDAESMKNLVFAAETSSAGAAAAVENGFESLLEVGTQTDALLEVTSGSSDACIIDLTMAKAMLGDDTNYKDLTIACELTSEEYGIGFRKGSDLTEIVNGYMNELIADGTLTALAEKYGLVLSADA